MAAGPKSESSPERRDDNEQRKAKAFVFPWVRYRPDAVSLLEVVPYVEVEWLEAHGRKLARFNESPFGVVPDGGLSEIDFLHRASS